MKKLLETFQLILQFIGIIFLAITSAGSIKYLIASYNRWRLRKKIEKLSKKQKDKAISEEKKKKIKEKIQKISIKRHYSSSARSILEGDPKRVNLSNIESQLWSIEIKLDDLNNILKRFKGYQKDLEPKFPDDFVSQENKVKEKTNDKSNEELK